MPTSDQEYRIEKDSMGPVKVPKEAYYGAQTQRAIQNFPISGWRFGRDFIHALGLIKYAAAKVNSDLGLLERRTARAIQKASEEVMQGRWDEQFVVDVFQTGSGTSTNMNANEVIANRANEILGGKKGVYRPVHPNDHVNLGQSSNDVFPSAIHIASVNLLQKRLVPALRNLHKSTQGKRKRILSHPQNWSYPPTGCNTYPIGPGIWRICTAGGIGLRRIGNAMESLSELPLGGTAVGTGINTHPTFCQESHLHYNKEDRLHVSGRQLIILRLRVPGMPR